MGQTLVTGPDGKKYRVTHPDGASNDEIYRQLQSNLNQAAPQDDGSWQWGDIPRGLAKGVAGLGMDIPGLGTPSVGELDPDLKKWAMSSRSGLETGSEFVGGAAPFVAGEIATGGAATPAAAARIATAFGRPAFRSGVSTLGELAKSMFWGGASSAAQPTKEGTLASHLEHGAEGAAAALPFGLAGRAISKLTPEVAEKVARHAATHGQAGIVGGGMHAAGVPWWASGGPWMLWRALHHSPLSNLAAGWAKSATPAAKAVSRGVEKTAPALVGTGIGQAQEDGDAQ